MLHETDVAKQRALAYQFDQRVLGEQAHYIHTYWWNRIVPYRSYMHGWKIGPSHYTNQDLSTIWLAPPKCDECSAAAPNGEKRAETTAK
jgi:peptide/nickel transport system substrate-binding protein